MKAPIAMPSAKWRILFSPRFRKSVTNARDGVLEDAEGLGETLAFRSGGIVFLGLAVEVGVAIANPPYGTWPERVFPVIADLMVAAGVFFEVLLSARAGACGGELRRRSNKRLADAERATEAANVRSAEAYRVSTIAAQELARATERLAKAEAENTALRERMLPRTMSSEAAQRIARAIWDFTGTPFTLTVDAAIEPYFLIDIWNVLTRGGGWVRKDPSGGMLASTLSWGPGAKLGLTVGHMGIEARVHSSRQPDLGKAAMALTTSLSAEGVDQCTVVYDEGTNPLACSPDAVHITIGRKHDNEIVRATLHADDKET
ncbi:MAG TPA: hypothetical protein VKT30_13205 [Caulobacteraceae bacterium]|nr:hypothetical protein [Caulobacteraceae bacterium]